nr:putative serine/threonine-protein phosphatase 2A regulatory subunit B'' subunit TON2 [Tanacetum cinerariifolium]
MLSSTVSYAQWSSSSTQLWVQLGLVQRSYQRRLVELSCRYIDKYSLMGVQPQTDHTHSGSITHTSLRSAVGSCLWCGSILTVMNMSWDSFVIRIDDRSVFIQRWSSRVSNPFADTHLFHHPDLGSFLQSLRSASVILEFLHIQVSLSQARIDMSELDEVFDGFLQHHEMKAYNRGLIPNLAQLRDMATPARCWKVERKSVISFEWKPRESVYKEGAA